jgi:hypothetical protein
MRRTWSDDDLRVAVQSNITIIGVIRTLGLSDSPGHYKPVRAAIERLGLDASHIKGKAHGTARGSRIELSEVLVKGRYSSSVHLRRRLIKEGLLQPVCALCSMGDSWNGKPLVLQLDHENGDPSDNRIENLRMLCPNCHSQTNTYTGRNCLGRYSRGINRCEQCRSPIHHGSKVCIPCNGKRTESKTEWPPADLLAVEVVRTSYRAAGKRLGVSDNAVKKYLKRRLGYAPRKYKVSGQSRN